MLIKKKTVPSPREAACQAGSQRTFREHGGIHLGIIPCREPLTTTHRAGPGSGVGGVSETEGPQSLISGTPPPPASFSLVALLLSPTF